MRIEYQRAIEEVYWRHRLWPEGADHPKPPLGQVLSEAALRAKVEQYVRKSNALEAIWGVSVSPSKLEAEMARIMRRTRRPGMLRELIHALDDDPHVVAECLVRPIVVDGLIRDAYKRDSRFQQAVRVIAEEDIRTHVRLDEVPRMHGTYTEQTWTRDTSVAGSHWRRVGEGTGRRSGPVLPPPSPGIDPALPLRRPGPWCSLLRTLGPHSDCERPLLPEPDSYLQEDDQAYYLTTTLTQSADRLRFATFRWDKVPFSIWWHSIMNRVSLEIREPAHSYGPIRYAGFPIGCSDDTWSPIVPPHIQRAGFTVIWTGSEMIVWGGYGATGELFNTGERYDPGTDTWTPTGLGPNVPEPRWGFTAVWTGTEMIIWGGYGARQELNTGGRYDPLTDLWRATSTGLPPNGPRYNHTAVWTGSEMIVWGGVFMSALLDSGLRYDPVQDTWLSTSVTPSTPSSRSYHTAVWTGSQMLVWGGWRYGSLPSDPGSSYDPGTDTWTQLPTGLGAPPVAALHSAIWTGSEMIVWGGYSSSGNTNVGGRYDPSTGLWRRTSTGASVPAARVQHASVWTGSQMIVWGGLVNGYYRNTGGRYDPTTDTWLPTSTGMNAPPTMGTPKAIWTGNEMIIWGYSSRLRNEGGRYDPLADSWTPVGRGPFWPLPRAFHSAVWTGAEMIIWGGSVEWSILLREGAIYDPATDTWRPTAISASTPSSRRFPSAVWTGRRMIVWGGLRAQSLADGALYDPMTDTWTRTSGTGAPKARFAHTAVWTGREMIVWGGCSRAMGLGSGGRYDPQKDKWLPVAQGGATPSGRWDHTAVWTGREMIVWGGQDGRSTLDSGGRYDPLWDRWAPTQSATAPQARYEHTSVWTGSEMIVWGGNRHLDGNGQIQSGGVYRPSSDTWRPTSIGTDTASHRSAHTAVWTGTEMIVWGGSGPGYPNNDGGRYDPVTDSWRSISPLDSNPLFRSYHTAVWTGSDMIVWGGIARDDVDAGGIYSATHILLRPGSLPDGVKGVFYTLQLLADGGSPPYSFALIYGSLPAGLRLSATGVISGVTNDVGTFSFVVGVTDGQGCTRLQGTTEFHAEAGNRPATTRGSLPGQRFTLVIRPTPATRGEKGHGRSIRTRSSLGE